MATKDAGSGATERDRLARTADGLTFARALIAVLLLPVLGTRRVVLGALLVGTAWISDFLDGRAARAAGTPTRLAGWDLAADTAVGAALVLGFTLSGWVPPAVGVGILALLGLGFVLTRNEALSMTLQAVGYALLLWRTWSDGHRIAFGWLVTVILVIAVVNRRELFERSLPVFFGGLAQVVRRHPPS